MKIRLDNIYLIGCTLFAVFLPHLIVDTTTTLTQIIMQILLLSAGVMGYIAFK